MGLVSPIGSKIDFSGDPIFQSAAWFFIIILKFIFSSIFEIQIHENKFLSTKKILFSKADFYKALHIKLVPKIDLLG